MIGLLQKKCIAYSVLFSLGFHAFILFGVRFANPHVNKSLSVPLQPMEVVLVNSKSRNAPDSATKMAQNNLDGGGNTTEDLHAKTPLPMMGDSEKFAPEQNSSRVKQLEQDARRLLIQLKSNYSVARESETNQPVSNERVGEDLETRSLEMARLEAEISKNNSAYESLPRRKFIGARTREYRYAQYVEDWRSKIERIGNLNYPQQARNENIYGKLTLTVSIRADGSVESVEISRSSGQRILDAAAMRIVKLAAPYAVFPPDIRKETDILSITRTWQFTTNDHFDSE